MDPAEISAALEIEPNRMWRAGDARLTANGRSLEGFREQTYWVAKIFDDCSDRYISDALEELVARFSAYKSFFKKIRSEGGKIEFYVSWNVGRNLGDDFKSPLLAALSDLNVDLSLDVYPPNTNVAD